MNKFKQLALSAVVLISGNCYAQGDILVVGVEASREPFVYLDKSEKIKGFEVDLLSAIAKESGLKAEFSNMPFDALLPSVLTEQIDVAVSCIAITEERAQIVDFVGPYYEAGLNAMIRNEYQGKIKNSYDLNGKTICVVAGTTCEEYAANQHGAQLLTYETERDSFSAIEQNKCDLLISDAPVIEYSYMKHSPGKYFKLNNNLTTEEFGIMTSKLRPEIREKIELGFKTLEKKGQINKLYKKWFN